MYVYEQINIMVITALSLRKVAPEVRVLELQ